MENDYNMQKGKEERILVISSIDPTKGPGVIGMDMYDAFIEHGYSERPCRQGGCTVVLHFHQFVKFKRDLSLYSS